MKFSISNIAWPKEWDSQIYDKLLELGFSAIEIAPNRTIQSGYDATDEEIDIWNHSYAHYFNEVSSMQSLLFKIDLPIFDSNENMENILNILYKGVLFASKLKVKNIVFGSPSIRNVFNDEQFQRSKIFFSKLSQYALEFGITVALEANPQIYNTNFMVSTLDTLDYVKTIKLPNFGINLDFGTMIENKELIHDIITNDNILYIKHVHISEPYLVKIDANRREYHIEVLKELLRFGYKGYISVEMRIGCTFDEIIEILKYIKAIGIEAGAFYEK